MNELIPNRLYLSFIDKNDFFWNLRFSADGTADKSECGLSHLFNR